MNKWGISLGREIVKNSDGSKKFSILHSQRIREKIPKLFSASLSPSHFTVDYITFYWFSSISWCHWRWKSACEQLQRPKLNKRREKWRTRKFFGKKGEDVICQRQKRRIWRAWRRRRRQCEEWNNFSRHIILSSRLASCWSWREDEERKKEYMRRVKYKKTTTCQHLNTKILVRCHSSARYARIVQHTQLFSRQNNVKHFWKRQRLLSRVRYKKTAREKRRNNSIFSVWWAVDRVYFSLHFIYF